MPKSCPEYKSAIYRALPHFADVSIEIMHEGRSRRPVLVAQVFADV